MQWFISIGALFSLVFPRYVQTGPAVQGIDPREAVNRLKKFKSEFDLLKRKHESYAAGEDLFALKKTEYPALIKTHKELTLLTKLYDLYMVRWWRRWWRYRGRLFDSSAVRLFDCSTVLTFQRLFLLLPRTL